MKNILLLLFAISAFSCSYAQKEAYIWYFGNRAGLNFNTTPPTPLSNGAINTMEGCASIADNNGNLLFYSDGLTIWNKNHAAMPNGNQLRGGMSSTQSTLIVRAPGSATIYYVFTAPTSGDTSGFYYSKVDMTLQGGLGDVAVKNVFVLTNITEKLCGIGHANGTDYWIVVHKRNSNGFYAYQLGTTGLNPTPTISNVGGTHTGSTHEIGYMKISPDGKKLACAARYNYFYELFDFDNLTGQISHPIRFSTNNVLCYGVEFSPDNSKLYFTDSNLWQVDLSSNDSAQIVASKQIISTAKNWALQLGPDGKIYLAMYSAYVSVINNPNALGTACNFVSNAINFGTAKCNLGLPNILTSYSSPAAPPPVAAFQASDSSFCAYDCINFIDKSTNNPTTWHWTFPGGMPSTSTDRNPFVCYLTPGIYNVTLVTYNTGGKDSLTVNNLIAVQPSPPVPIITQVNGDTLYCTTDTSYISYQWTNDNILITGATDSMLVISKDGNYNVQVTNYYGCRTSAGINIILSAINYTMPATHPLYPNPVKEKLSFKNESSRPGRIDIYNMAGQLSYSDIAKTQSDIVVDVSHLPSGIYYIHFFAGKVQWFSKFVKD